MNGQRNARQWAFDVDLQFNWTRKVPNKPLECWFATQRSVRSSPGSQLRLSTVQCSLTSVDGPAGEEPNEGSCRDGELAGQATSWPCRLLDPVDGAKLCFPASFPTSWHCLACARVPRWACLEEGNEGRGRAEQVSCPCMPLETVPGYLAILKR